MYKSTFISGLGQFHRINFPQVWTLSPFDRLSHPSLFHPPSCLPTAYWCLDDSVWMAFILRRSLGMMIQGVWVSMNIFWYNLWEQYYVYILWCWVRRYVLICIYNKLQRRWEETRGKWEVTVYFSCYEWRKMETFVPDPHLSDKQSLSYQLWCRPSRAELNLLYM